MIPQVLIQPLGAFFTKGSSLSFFEIRAIILNPLICD